MRTSHAKEVCDVRVEADALKESLLKSQDMNLECEQKLRSVEESADHLKSQLEEAAALNKSLKEVSL